MLDFFDFSLVFIIYMCSDQFKFSALLMLRKNEIRKESHFFSNLTIFGEIQGGGNARPRGHTPSPHSFFTTHSKNVEELKILGAGFIVYYVVLWIYKENNSFLQELNACFIEANSELVCFESIQIIFYILK